MPGCGRRQAPSLSATRGGRRVFPLRQPPPPVPTARCSSRHALLPHTPPGGTHRRTGEVPAGPVSGRNSPSARQNHLGHRAPHAPSVPVRRAERLFGFFGANGKFYGGRCRAARGLIAVASRGLSGRSHRKSGFEGLHGLGRSCRSRQEGIAGAPQSQLGARDFAQGNGPPQPHPRNLIPRNCT